MITILSSKAAPSKVVDGVTKSREVFCLVGLSSDTKPTTSYKGILICNGSSFIEVDTGTTYMYDEEGGTWTAQSSGGSGGGSGSPSLAEVLQLITLAMGNNPITRIVVEDAAETEIEIENWDTEYVIPGTSLETLTITLPETTPTPTIILPEGLVIVGGYPEQDGDRWVLTIDNNLTATAMVIPNPTV